MKTVLKKVRNPQNSNELRLGSGCKWDCKNFRENSFHCVCVCLPDEICEASFAFVFRGTVPGSWPLGSHPRASGASNWVRLGRNRVAELVKIHNDVLEMKGGHIGKWAMCGSVEHPPVCLCLSRTTLIGTYFAESVRRVGRR